MKRPSAAILTIGSELTAGLRVDTNSATIARALVERGFDVEELVSVGDDVDAAATAIGRLIETYSLVISTGGLGPTHDDITREAAARALHIRLERDPRLERLLETARGRHRAPEAAARVLSQADIIPGSETIDFATGTAPGLVIRTRTGTLALLPGPPSEMRPMLDTLLARYDSRGAAPLELGVVGLTESDAQIIVERALRGHDGVRLTVLARPGDVRVVLADGGAGAPGLARAADEAVRALAEHCYATDGSSLAQALVTAAESRALTIGLAESCTGGLAASAITAVPGASACFRGCVVAYHDAVKRAALGVTSSTLDARGAVSREVAVEMAEGARSCLSVDVAVSITGIAGPSGGSDEKPVGLAWFGVAGRNGTRAVERRFPPTSRGAVRDQAVATALDLLRREVLSL